MTFPASSTRSTSDGISCGSRARSPSTHTSSGALSRAVANMTGSASIPDHREPPARELDGHAAGAATGVEHPSGP